LTKPGLEQVMLVRVRSATTCLHEPSMRELKQQQSAAVPCVCYSSAAKPSGAMAEPSWDDEQSRLRRDWSGAETRIDGSSKQVLQTQISSGIRTGWSRTRRWRSRSASRSATAGACSRTSSSRGAWSCRMQEMSVGLEEARVKGMPLDDDMFLRDLQQHEPEVSPEPAAAAEPGHDFNGSPRLRGQSHLP